MTGSGVAPDAVGDPAEDPRLTRFYRQRLSWRGCSGGVECVSLTVPVDWARPEGATIDVALARKKASGDRLGALVFNPGGPGVAALPYVRASEQLIGDTLAEHYDFVGFDPRGVGESAPVRCLTDAETERMSAADSTPDDATELARTVADLRDFGEACRRRTGELLGHVDTLSVVRDLDVLRAALGERVLTFWGASYGTLVGARYAETFPWRVGRMLLDGAVDPSLTSEQYLEGQAIGFDRGLRRYVAHCQGRRRCPLTGDVEHGLRQLGDLVAATDSAPLPTDGSRKLTQSLLITGLAQGLYDDGSWDGLTDGLREAFSGEGTELLSMADQYLDRDRKGRYGQVNAASPAVFCLDHPESRTPEQIRTDASAVQDRLSPLGGAIAWGALGCASWPEPGAVPDRPVDADGSAPVLVVGTVGDPATPYEWAQALAGQLSSARLLTWEGSGHTAFRRGSDCVDAAVEAYLVSGALPAEGTRCPASDG
ncbi:MAG: alpha/beta hydrolase [Actinomycetales bacterium]|nr:alpha/beta hydrolase [Actinomycetales bacterium]